MATSPKHFSASPCGSPLPRRPQTAFGKASSPLGTERDFSLLLKRSMSEPVNRRSKKGQPGPLLQQVDVPVKQAAPAAPKPGRVFVCYYCQAEFLDALSLTKHSRTHGGARPYSCTQCGCMFALYSSLMTHQRSHAPGGRPAAVFRCPSCPAMFLHEASLKAHQRRHNDFRSGPEAKPYQCDTCQEWMSNEGSLKIHMQRHEGFETPRICSLCGTCFSCDAFLRAHGKLHDAEPTTRCVICIRHFRRSRVLLRHSDVHADERQNVCDSCERRFPKVADGSWRRMQMLVSEERKFQCLYCGVSFSRLHQLAAHEAGHIAPSPPATLGSQMHLPSVVVN